MKQDELQDRDAPGLESMLAVKLEVLLHDLLGKHGPVDTAKKLGVNYKTVARCVESGKLSVHLRQALADWLLERGKADSAPRGESESLGEAMDRLSVEIRNALEDLRREVKSGFDSLGTQQAGEMEKLARGLDISEPHPPKGTKIRLSGTDMTWPRGSQPRREFRRTHPSVVTMKPQEGDDAVYGDTWSPVKEWRDLRLSHPYEGSGVDWLEREILLRQLEVVLIGEHGLTLPPDTDPWDSLDRKTQVQWRNQTLDRLRKEIFWARVRRFLRCVLTAKRWRD